MTSSGPWPEHATDCCCEQRRCCLRLTTRRRTHQAAFAVRVNVIVIVVVVVIPGVRAGFSGAVVASGALLVARAFVFQVLLRVFTARLGVLFDDRYASIVSMDLEGLCGEVVDLGLLSTGLRCAGSRAMSVPTSGCEPVVNPTKLCNGADLRLPAAPGGLALPQALELARQHLTALAPDSIWQPFLLQSRQRRGVSCGTSARLRSTP